jgi:hypothetical protein
VERRPLRDTRLAAAPPFDRQRPEAVQFRLEEEVGMIERLRDPEEPHGVHGSIGLNRKQTNVGPSGSG